MTGYKKDFDAYCREHGLNLYLSFETVSYTHLDVYKRQGQLLFGEILTQADVAAEGVVEEIGGLGDVAHPLVCLLYTSAHGRGSDWLSIS